MLVHLTFSHFVYHSICHSLDLSYATVSHDDDKLLELEKASVRLSADLR
jgi:hypothetical protein